MDEPLLEIRGLNKIYDNGFHAVRDVSFSLPAGKLVGLIGPNGCGKSTMMRCINKMHMLTSGDILISRWRDRRPACGACHPRPSDMACGRCCPCRRRI